MAIVYKDIGQLTQKSSVAGTEKIEVSDTEYITPSQIAGLAGIKVYEFEVTQFSVIGYISIPSTLYAECLSDISNGKVPIIRLKTMSNGEVTEQRDYEFDTYDSDGITFTYFKLNTNYRLILMSSGSVAAGDDMFERTIFKTSSWSATPNNVYYPSEKLVKDSLDEKQDTLVSGTNIKTINNQSLLGSGNITISGGGDTTDCVHKTGDESVGGDKTFTDNIAVVDASHILYSGASPSQGFTRGESAGWANAAANSYTITGLEGEPKAFVIGISHYNLPTTGSQAVLCVVGDSTGCHGVYTTGTQHNYSSGFTTSYSNGTFTITAPTGVVFNEGYYGISYYYGSGTLTFKTATVTPGSGVTAVTFTGTSLTEMPVMYAAMLETQVNSESYRRVALYTDSCYEGDAAELESLGITFFSQQVAATTSSFSVSYNNGLYINSGGTNAGGYFHNPGTYTLYYLMASDIGSGGGGGSYSSLADELAAINTTIGDIETILASI